MAFDPTKKLTRANFSRLPVLCTDGAWGTELMKLGGKPGEVKDFWNVSAPEKVLQVAKSYVDAGSHIILTNTFNANRIVLAQHNAAERVAEINKAGAAVSKKAAKGKAYVFASIGPTGKMVTTGDLSAKEAEEVFAEQAAALAAGGADAIVVETQTDLEEAKAGLKAAIRATKIPVGVTFTFDSGKDKDRTMMGVSVAQAYEMAKANGASFVGANCGLGIEGYIAIAQAFAKCGNGLPIWIKGNAGKPEPGPDGKPVYKATPDVFAKAAKPLLDAGVHFIGGCCGSTPAHIRALVDAVRKAQK
ncbi:MAG: homocysteine S-methyltransferase family protein [Planctomycetota bacterium]|nr:homocysteine S-methyltransferase family protein [Planctomycetota bacterium]